MKKVMSKKDCMAWLEGNFVASSIALRLTGQYGQFFDAQGVAISVVFEQAEAEAMFAEVLAATLKKHFSEFWPCIQNREVKGKKSFPALSYRKNGTTQARYSQGCKVEIVTRKLDGVLAIFHKIGFAIRKVFDSTQTVVWVIEPMPD